MAVTATSPSPFACKTCRQQVAETSTQRALTYLPWEQKQFCSACPQLPAGSRKRMDGISDSEPSTVACDFSGATTVICQLLEGGNAGSGRFPQAEKLLGGRDGVEEALLPLAALSWVHAWYPCHPACLNSPYFFLNSSSSKQKLEDAGDTGQKSSSKTGALNIKAKAYTASFGKSQMRGFFFFRKAPTEIHMPVFITRPICVFKRKTTRSLGPAQLQAWADHNNKFVVASLFL